MNKTKILYQVLIGKMLEEIGAAKTADLLITAKTALKQIVEDNLTGYRFDDENGQEVTVLSHEGEHCMVDQCGEYPYILPSAFIQSIKDESDQAAEANHNAKYLPTVRQAQLPITKKK